MSGEKKGSPWLTLSITLALVVFYAVWLTHSYTWNGTPLDGAVVTFFTGAVPLGTVYIAARVLSWVLRKPFDHWSTEE